MPTGPRIPESELLLRVQQRIDDGGLPVAMPASINAGYGNGADVCRVCDEQITQDQVMYDVGDPRSPDQFTFHLTCYMTWQRECAYRVAADKKRSRSNAPPDPSLKGSDDEIAARPDGLVGIR